MAGKLEALFSDYAAYHRAPGNKTCHLVGIPLIVFTLVGMLMELDPLAAILVAGLAIFYYAALSGRYAVAMSLVLAIFFLLAPRVPFGVHAFAFVLGWVLQFVGHYAYERRSPAFFKNLQHLLVGPLWVLSEISGRFLVKSGENLSD